jgi:cell division protein FtsL
MKAVGAFGHADSAQRRDGQRHRRGLDASSESRAVRHALTQLQNQRDDLNIEYGKLELEQATYAEPRRIDTKRATNSAWPSPRPQDIRLVQE